MLRGKLEDVRPVLLQPAKLEFLLVSCPFLEKEQYVMTTSHAGGRVEGAKILRAGMWQTQKSWP